MTRKELVHEVYQIFIRDNIAYGENDLAIWKALAETDDDSLEEFYYSHKEKP